MAKRKIKQRPKGKQERQGYWPRIVIKFHDYVELPYEDGVERYLGKQRIGSWESMVKEFPGLGLRRLFTALKPDRIRSLVDQARELDKTYDPPDLFGFFVADCPPGVAPERLVEAFGRWPTVECAYFDPPGSDPTVDPSDDPRFANQGYLGPAPDGIDAEYAWPRADGSGFDGGDGAGINFIDMEKGWTLDHDDLAAHGATLLHGNIGNHARSHGTSVLGEVCAVDNQIGCIGVAPGIASVNVVSYNGSSRPDAILAAIGHLQFGDVLLLEAQDKVITGEGIWNAMPIEIFEVEFEAIRLATALGIVVVETAGNGKNDLDTFTSGGKAILNRGSDDFRDSGAIMVGAATSTVPHERVKKSNYGSRVDCYAWGENVETCASNSVGSKLMYTSTFKGTSAAAPIVTGAALVVQGIAEANLLYRFSPRQMRAILSDPATGTLSADPATDRIGVMPDLRAILQGNVLNLAPDVYIRDFAGDTGDPHSGSISASPDIILRPDTVADPQASFGEGSGTENDKNLGYTAKENQDNHVYVRLRNRGGSDAPNVKTRIYWAPVATLITSDLWTYVGEVTIPNVPTGDILTVSDPITWPAAAIPGPGHYCFVGITGTQQDPGPDPADFLDMNNFKQFIRKNNNVTWRNFNVVKDGFWSGGGFGFAALPFLAPGAPDKGRDMRLDVVAKLPRGSKVQLEIPAYMADALEFRPPFVEFDAKRGVARLPVNPHGEFTLGELFFKARSRAELKLLVRIPERYRKNSYEVFVRQLWDDFEVGRVTWRLLPGGRTKPPARKKKSK